MSRALRTVHSPEHVQIALVPAGLGSRYAAFFIDLLFIAGLTSGVHMATRVLPPSIRDALSATAAFLITWGYHVLFEVLRAGRSPGKAMMRLRVVDGRGLPIALSQSLVRNVVRALDMVPLGGVGMIAAALDPHHRRLGDLVADTLVVEEGRVGPPDLERAGARRHNSLRTARVRRLVDARVGVEERELLLALCVRAPKLDERARYDLFERAGEHYRSKLGIDDPHLGGEAIVRGLVSLCYGDRE